MNQAIFSSNIGRSEIPVHSITGMYWLNKSALSPSEIASLKWELEFTGRSTMPGNPPPFARMWVETEKLFGVPRSFGFKKYGLLRPSQPLREVVCPIPGKVSLRDDQPRVFEETVAAIREEWGGLVHAPCAFGKTVLGIRIAQEFGLRTLVVVDKDTLANQWVAQIRKFCPGVKVGRIQGETAEYHDCHVVVGMVQSLSQRQYPADLYTSFGLFITDEVHRLGAPTWGLVAALFSAPYRLGLSATPSRGDDMDVVFRYHVGRIVSRGKITASSLVPDVYVVKSGILPEDLPLNKWGRPPNVSHQATLHSALAACEHRTALIVRLIIQASMKGRRILVLSHRTEHLRAMSRALLAQGYDATIFAGTTTEKDEAKAREARIVLGTYQKAKEGISIDHLDTLVMATPAGSVQQAAGRILRIHPGKKPPIILDVVDGFGDALRTYRFRCGQYKKLGYPIHA